MSLIFAFVFCILVGFTTSIIERKIDHEICRHSVCMIERNETCMSLPVSTRTRKHKPSCVRNDFVCSYVKKLSVDVSDMSPAEVFTITEDFDISRVYSYGLVYGVYRWKSIRNPRWWWSLKTSRFQTYSFRPKHHEDELIVLLSASHDWKNRDCLLLRVLSKARSTTSRTTTTRTMTTTTTTTLWNGIHKGLHHCVASKK